jgi:hypothetical protein
LTKLIDTETSNNDLKDDTTTTLLIKRQKKFDHVPDKGLGIVTESGEIILQPKKPDE